MTSTPFNIGIAEDRRPASRVLCPPGGQHADIFGNVPSPPRYSRRQAFQVQAAQAAEAAAAVAAAATNGTKTETVNAAPEVLPEAVPDASCNISVTPESAAPLTVTTIETEVATPAPETTTSAVNAPKRVRVPPGGFSSKLW